MDPRDRGRDRRSLACLQELRPRKATGRLPVANSDGGRGSWARRRRSGDLFRLPWAAVDLKEGLLRIPREKTGEECLIPISEALRLTLVDLQKRAMARKDDRELVLGEFSEASALRYFRIAKRLAGIKRRFRFHDLRHSFACRHAANGTPLQVIQRMMGHASIKTTERYSRVDVNAVKAAGHALDCGALNSGLNSGMPASGAAASSANVASDSKKAG